MHRDREVRVTKISKVDDPNEELLHWVDAMELSRTVYSANPTASNISTAVVIEDSASSTSPHTTNTNLAKSRSRQSSSTWDQIAMDAFFQLTVDAEAKARFLSRERSQNHDELLVETLEELLNEQSGLQESRKTTLESSGDDDNSISSDDSKAVRVTFINTLERIVCNHQERPLSDATRAKVIRNLRKAFAILRNSGILFLEDEDSDRHVMLSFEFALKPALLQLVRGTCALFFICFEPVAIASGVTIVIIADCKYAKYSHYQSMTAACWRSR